MKELRRVKETVLRTNAKFELNTTEIEAAIVQYAYRTCGIKETANATADTYFADDGGMYKAVVTIATEQVMEKAMPPLRPAAAPPMPMPPAPPSWSIPPQMSVKMQIPGTYRKRMPILHMWVNQYGRLGLSIHPAGYNYCEPEQRIEIDNVNGITKSAMQQFDDMRQFFLILGYRVIKEG